MRKISCLAILVFVTPLVLGHGGSHSQTSGLADAGKVPGDLLYGLDRAQESLSLAFSFSDRAKAEKRLDFAEERLAESVHLIENNRSDEAERTVRDYVELTREANKTATELNNSELQESINERLESRNELFQELQAKLPEEADTGLQNMMRQRPETIDNRKAPPTGGFLIMGGEIPES